MGVTAAKWPASQIYAMDIETEGLDNREHRVISVAVYSERVSMVLAGEDEQELLTGLAAFMHRQAPGLLVTWNGAIFDGPFLEARAKILGLPDSYFVLAPNPEIQPKYEPQPGYKSIGYDLQMKANPGRYYSAASSPSRHEHLDIAYLWKDWAASNDVHWSLKTIARAVGLQDIIEVDRAHMELLSTQQLMMYNLSDVMITHQLTLRLIQMQTQEVI